MKLLFIGISALALATSPAFAQGNGNGNGKDRNEAAAHAQGHGQHQDTGQQGRGNDRGSSAHAENGNRGNGNNAAQRPERNAPPARENSQRNSRNENSSDARERADNASRRGNSADRPTRPDNRGNGASDMRRDGDDRSRGAFWSSASQDRHGSLVEYRPGGYAIADGCPPGLARKYNGCRPPGLAKKQDDVRYRSYAPQWWGLGGLFGNDGNYFYDDGYLLRLGGDGLISGYIPLLGGALSVGNRWPSDYRYSRLPSYYESYYGLGRADYYRYADNVVYRLDPETAAITSIAAMLTGNDFTIGQPLPSGYDIYNVPYSYRDRYRDGPDAMYRYNDGYVYEIDPETMLIASAIELLV